MALSKSDNSGSNVTNLEDARNKRGKSRSRRDEADAEIPDESEFGQNVAATAPPDAETTSKISNRRFDHVKVARIKAELERGEYQINYLRVADKFIEHERYS